LLVSGLGIVLRGSRFAAIGMPLVVIGPVVGLLVANPSHGGLPGGGSAVIRTYVVPLVGMALVVLAARWLGRRTVASRDRRGADIAVTVMLVLLPAVQAAGTGNALAYLAVNQFACWTALMVAACTALATARVASTLAISATACAVAVAATTGADGLLRHPYRTAEWSAATTAIGGTGPLASVRVDRATAERLRAVRTAVGQQHAGDPVMAFDEMAGIVLLLDGRSVGEAWYSRIDQGRTAAGIRSVCTRERPWGDTLPVVVYDRAPSGVDQDALRACGVSLSRDYTLVPVDQGEPHLRVYVPKDGERTGP
jgi:hypothetical protein